MAFKLQFLAAVCVAVSTQWQWVVSAEETAEVQGMAQVEQQAGSDNPACYGVVPQWLKARVHNAPACLATCPEICGPLTVAMDGYVLHGEQPAFEKAVCDHIDAFACTYGAGSAACQGMGALMVANGVNPPTSYAVLRETCRTKYLGGR